MIFKPIILSSLNKSIAFFMFKFNQHIIFTRKIDILIGFKIFASAQLHKLQYGKNRLLKMKGLVLIIILGEKMLTG